MMNGNLLHATMQMGVLRFKVLILINHIVHWNIKFLRSLIAPSIKEGDCYDCCYHPSYNRYSINYWYFSHESEH